MELNEILLYLNPTRLIGTRWRPLTIVGPPESGKTTLSLFLAQKIVEIQGEEDTNIILSKRLKTAIDHMDDKRYQVLIIDDAVRFQYSRYFSSTEGRIAVSNYYEIRHIYNQYRKQHRDAVIVIMFLTQRWRDLSPQFREAPIVMFKGTLTSIEANRDIKKLIGEYFNILRDITREIYVFSNDEAKSKAVVTTSWLDSFILSGIRELKPRNINYIEEEESIEDLVEQFVEAILTKFSEKVLKVPNSIIRGFIRQYAIEHGIDVIPLDSVDIAKYRAYEIYGLATEQPEVNIREMAEEIVEEYVLKNPAKWDILMEDEKIGLALYYYPFLNNNDAKKIVKIVDFITANMGIKTRYITTSQAAALLGVSKRTIINMIHKNKITDITETEGGHYRVNISEILQIKNRKNGKNGK